MRKRCGSIGHLYTIPNTANVWTTKTHQPTLPKKTHRGWKNCQTQNLSRMVHKHPFLESIYTKRESYILGKINIDTLESLIGKLNHASHVISLERYLLNRLRHLFKIGKIWVPQRLQPNMDQIPPTGCHQRCTNQQHSLCHTNIHPMVRRLWMQDWRLHPQRPSMVMENTARIAW